MKNHRLATAAGAPATPTPPVTRCEDRIRIAKDTSLANLPLKSIAASVALASMAAAPRTPTRTPTGACPAVFAFIRA